MLKLIIGAVIGIVIYHNFPSEVQSFATKTNEVVHEGAAKAAEMTKPKSDLDRITEKLK